MSRPPRPSGRAGSTDLRSALALLRDWCAIVAVAAVSIRLDHWLAWLVAVWIIGAFQFAIGEALQHEAVHRKLFTRRALNDRLEFLYALPFFRTVSQFRAEHLVHHRRLGTGEDQLVEDYRALGLLRPRPNAAWLWFGKPLLGLAGLYYASTISLAPAREGAKILLFWAAAVGAAWWLGGLDILFLYWIVPWFWAANSFLYWSEVEDHYNTRSGTRSNLSPLLNWITHDNGYHHAHHSHPGQPWFRLREIHRRDPAAGDVSRGFLDTFRQIRVPLPEPARGFPAPAGGRARPAPPPAEERIENA